MKHLTRILTGCALVAALSTAYAIDDPLHLAGTYKCTGHDSHDGSDDGIWTITLDSRTSDLTSSVTTYSFTSKDVLDGAYHDTYAGSIIARDNLLGIYFQNKNMAASPTDVGVGVGKVAQVQDGNGNFTISFNMDYYQPDYMREQKGSTGKTGGIGTNQCVKMG